MAKIVQVHGQAQLQWQAQRSSSGRWIGTCNAIGLVTEADSLDELHSVIDESIQLLLVDLLRDNELDAFLREHGWQARVPVELNPAEIRFQVPWELIAQGNRDTARAAH